MIGKTVVKKCSVCGKEWECVVGSRLIREVKPNTIPTEFKDSLSIINDFCGCPEPKEFIIK